MANGVVFDNKFIIPESAQSATNAIEYALFNDLITDDESNMLFAGHIPHENLLLNQAHLWMAPHDKMNNSVLPTIEDVALDIERKRYNISSSV